MEHENLSMHEIRNVHLEFGCLLPVGETPLISKIDFLMSPMEGRSSGFFCQHLCKRAHISSDRPWVIAIRPGCFGSFPLSSSLITAISRCILLNGGSPLRISRQIIPKLHTSEWVDTMPCCWRSSGANHRGLTLFDVVIPPHFQATWVWSWIFDLWIYVMLTSSKNLDRPKSDSKAVPSLDIKTLAYLWLDNMNYNYR